MDGPARLARATLLHTEHGTHFAGGPARDVDELQQLISRAALKTLGNIVGDRERRAIELVAKPPTRAESLIVQQLLGGFIQLSRLLPHRQVFKTLVSHKAMLAISNLKSQISNTAAAVCSVRARSSAVNATSRRRLLAA